MNIKRFICKKLHFFAIMFFLPSVTNAQLMWNIRGGIFPASVHEDIIYDENATTNKIDWMAEFGLEIPVSKSWNIETALRYRSKNFVAYYDEEYDKYGIQLSYKDEAYMYNDNTVRYIHTYKPASILELPIRATYKLRLNNSFSLHLGCGPYVSFNLSGKPFNAGHEFKSSALSVGIEPSAALYYKNLSIGVIYNNPVFFQRHKEMDSNRFMLTLGFRFGKGVFRAIGKGLDTFVESGAADALGSALQNATNAMGGNTATPVSTYSTPSSSSSSSSKVSSSSNEKKYDLGEQHNYNTAKKTWKLCDDNLSNHFYGGRPATGNDVRQWQKSMKDLRAKWAAKGKSFPNSTNETHSTANCPNKSHSH